MMYEPKILSVFCCSISNSILTDVFSIPVFSISSLEHLENQKELDPLAIIMDLTSNSHKCREFLAAIQLIWPNVVSIALVPKGENELFHSAFEAGFHDVCTKPINSIELLARFKIRHQEQLNIQKITMCTFGDLKINTFSKKLKVRNGEIQLSSLACSVLMKLIEHPNILTKREEIKKFAWNGVSVSEGVLDRQIFEIRKSLKQLNSKVEIKSVYGEGYLITQHSEESNSSIISIGCNSY